jgi:hypothetical protein
MDDINRLPLMNLTTDVEIRTQVRSEEAEIKWLRHQ